MTQVPFLKLAITLFFLFGTLICQAENSPLKNPDFFGYKTFRALISEKNVNYFLVRKRSYTGITDIVAIHGISETQIPVDADIFYMKNMSGGEDLGYILSDAEINKFNTLIGPALSEHQISNTKIRVYHHVSGVLYPEPFVEHEGEDDGINFPVFVTTYHLDEGKQKWLPDYVDRPYGVGSLSDFRHRYNFQSTYQYLNYLNRAYTKNNKSETKDVQVELRDALQYSSKESMVRRKNRPLWTKGYWSFYDYLEGLDIINGNFSTVNVGHDFESFFTSFLVDYSNNCRSSLKDPSEFRHIHIHKKWDEYGNLVMDDYGETSVFVDARYADKYEEYYNSAKSRLATQSAGLALKSVLFGNGATYGFFAKDIALMETSATFFHAETCNSPLMNRLYENLLRKAYGRTALSGKDGLTAVEDSAAQHIPVKSNPTTLVVAEQNYSFQTIETLNNRNADFLLVKFLHGAINDGILKNMATARWLYEKSTNSVNSPPVGGRFFANDAQSLSEQELSDSLPKFREWMLLNAKKLPNRWLLTSAVYVAPSSNSPKIIPLNRCFKMADVGNIAEWMSRARNSQQMQSSNSVAPSSESLGHICLAKNVHLRDKSEKCMGGNTERAEMCQKEWRTAIDSCIANKSSEGTAPSRVTIAWANANLNDEECAGDVNSGQFRTLNEAYLGNGNIELTPFAPLIQVNFGREYSLQELMPNTGLISDSNYPIQLEVELTGAKIQVENDDNISVIFSSNLLNILLK